MIVLMKGRRPKLAVSPANLTRTRCLSNSSSNSSFRSSSSKAQPDTTLTNKSQALPRGFSRGGPSDGHIIDSAITNPPNFVPGRSHLRPQTRPTLRTHARLCSATPNAAIIIPNGHSRAPSLLAIIVSLGEIDKTVESSCATDSSTPKDSRQLAHSLSFLCVCARDIFSTCARPPPFLTRRPTAAAPPTA